MADLLFTGGWILIASSVLLLLGVEGGTPHLLTLAVALEVLLLALALTSVACGGVLDDASGSLIALLILPLAGAESAVMLAHLIALAPLRGTILLR